MKHFRHFPAGRLVMAALAAVLITAGCGEKPPITCQVLDTAVATGDFPRSMAVLPFRDFTATEGLADLVRISFYSHLSTLPYRDVELQNIDYQLGKHGLNDHRKLSKVSVKQIGELLRCDAVVFGTVLDFQRLFAGIYASITVSAAIQVWDTRTGRMVWADNEEIRTYEGGVPLSLIDLPMITVRSGLHMRNGIKVQAIEDLTRKLAENLPVPSSIANPRSPSEYTLQAGAFSEPDRARKLQDDLKKNGYPVFIRRNNDPRGIWHRVMIGPFSTLHEAMQTKERLSRLLGRECFLVPRNS